MDIGLVGLAVMGENLVLNIRDKGYTVSVYNRTYSKTEDFVKRSGVPGYKNLIDFIQSLKRPRKIILMVKSGMPVDIFLEQLKEHLTNEDIVIDCGNSNFKDTIMRISKYKEYFHFAGAGVSGGEEGARHGPSIMVGSNAYVWNNLKDIFCSIAAKSDDGSCCRLMGPDGAGHFVKMVHNGIEYGMMQMISEIYMIMAQYKTNEEISKIFEQWDKGICKGYLIEICNKIFKSKDDKYVIDEIDDKAEQKGTGSWCSILSLETGQYLPIITASVYARIISSKKELREKYSSLFHSNRENNEEIIKSLESAYYCGMICCYYEGLTFIRSISDLYSWNINLKEVIMAWKGGCIIRTQYLNVLKNMNLNEEPFKDFIELVKEHIYDLRKVIIYSVQQEIPTPALSASISFLDGLKTKKSGANLLQAMRDFFGAHMVTRNGGDKEHLNWDR
ncbi:6-phosphogluconate dehydrogenase [Spraguea lophii 42_110]|uniref:6-phosphogluconate dehydrogenase, decarboxylating n=1 Tax=Spraguea lophii (strain 42_110) TaxID=1358809 RepID=S7XRB7_SPRLO|nr:6-phosphogluconate dehydrogenase [Spraguea lophii 42_110]